jgi:predicted DNA-binding protein (MmcQ/YjbR family)
VRNQETTQTASAITAATTSTFFIGPQITIAGRRKAKANVHGEPAPPVRPFGSHAIILCMATRKRPIEQVTAICMAMPEATVEHSGSHATFRVRKKVFAYFLDDHHGDGIVSVCVKTQLGENLDLVKRDPGRFYMPAYIGSRGWVGIRVDVKGADWDEVGQFVKASYRAVAPKMLARAV